MQSSVTTSPRFPRLYSWLLALLIPAFAVQIALTTPIEEHAFDAAAFHVWRGVVFSAARAEGDLYPRWVMPINGGLGGPLFSFYSPLPYYLTDILHTLGFSHPIAWRVFTALSLIVGSLGMFALGLALFRRADFALAAAACFTYAPYLLRDFFERGAPQGAAIALYPWLLLLLLRLEREPSAWRLILAALCWSALVLMHNLSAALLLPILAIFGFYVALRNGPRVLLFPALALILGVLLISFHVLPFLTDSKYVQLDAASQDPTVQPARNPLALVELTAPPAVFDTNVDNNSSGFGVGLLHLLIIVAGIPVSAILWRRRQKPEAVLLGGLMLWGLFTLWMQLDVATPIWAAQPGLNILQFRVRLLNTFGLVAAIVLGYVLMQLPRYAGAVAAVVGTAIILMQFPSLYPTLLHRYIEFPAAPTVDDARAWAMKNHIPGLTLTTSKELTPIWRNLPYFSDEEVAKIAASPVAEMPQGAKILSDERHNRSLRFQINSPQGFTAAVYVLYFPGWTATVNGQPAAINPAQGTGYTLIDIPAGISTVEMRYDGTAAQHTGDAISLATTIALIGVLVLWRRNPESSVQGTSARYLTPRWWLPVVIVALVALKGVWIDPATTLFHAVSTCQNPKATAVQVDFGGRVHLCSFSQNATVIHPGDLVQLMAYWQLDNPQTELSYSFVHLVGSTFNPETNNPVWGQQDKQTPGTLPITLWGTDKLYQDVYEFRVPSNTPPGDYQLEIGWTDTAGQRLIPVISHAPSGVARSDLDALVLGTVTVR